MTAAAQGRMEVIRGSKSMLGSPGGKIDGQTWMAMGG